MNNLKVLADNPLAWILVLLIIQVSSTFYVEQVIEFEFHDQVIYEKMLSDSSISLEFANLFKAQQGVIESRNEIIEASISRQRTIGGICVIILVMHLFSLNRRSRVE